MPAARCRSPASGLVTSCSISAPGGRSTTSRCSSATGRWSRRPTPVRACGSCRCGGTACSRRRRDRSDDPRSHGPGAAPVEGVGPVRAAGSWRTCRPGRRPAAPQPRSVDARPECPGRFGAREVRQRPAQGPGRQRVNHPRRGGRHRGSRRGRRGHRRPRGTPETPGLPRHRRAPHPHRPRRAASATTLRTAPDAPARRPSPAAPPGPAARARPARRGEQGVDGLGGQLAQHHAALVVGCRVPGMAVHGVDVGDGPLADVVVQWRGDRAQRGEQRLCLGGAPDVGVTQVDHRAPVQRRGARRVVGRPQQRHRRAGLVGQRRCPLRHRCSSSAAAERAGTARPRTGGRSGTGRTPAR